LLWNFLEEEGGREGGRERVSETCQSNPNTSYISSKVIKVDNRFL
jgi:hypothetical protein